MAFFCTAYGIFLVLQLACSTYLAMIQMKSVIRDVVGV